MMLIIPIINISKAITENPAIINHPLKTECVAFQGNREKLERQ
jgi:hypothetical protein